MWFWKKIDQWYDCSDCVEMIFFLRYSFLIIWQNVNMGAKGKTNSALCRNNWVRKLHGNRNFCLPEDIAAPEVCEKCSFDNKWSLLCVEKL